MTIEAAVALPVFIIVAVVTTNAMLLFSECAAFDRLAHIAVRTYATSPAYGQNQAQSCALVQQQLERVFDKPYMKISVQDSSIGEGYVCFTATLEYAPTLFGMGLRDEVLGIKLPRASHSIECVVDPYRSGLFI